MLQLIYKIFAMKRKLENAYPLISPEVLKFRRISELSLENTNQVLLKRMRRAFLNELG